MTDFVDVIFDDMLEALKKEELGKKVSLTYEKPDSSIDSDDLKSDIADAFDDAFNHGYCLLMYEAYDYESSGTAKCQHWFENLGVVIDDKVTVSFNTAIKCVLEIDIEGYFDSFDLTKEEFDKIAEIEALNCDGDDDDCEGFADTIIGEGGFTMHHIGGGVYCDDDGDNWDFF